MPHAGIIVNIMMRMGMVAVRRAHESGARSPIIAGNKCGIYKLRTW
jgi:hypothetical protein